MNHVKHFEDLNFVVSAEVKDLYVEFKIYEVLGWEVDGSRPIFCKADGKYCQEPAMYMQDAEIYAHGSVKWDGCSNWSFDEQDRGIMLHGCSRQDLLNLGIILAECWSMAGELMPEFDP